MNINVDQIKQNACKALALIDLIERSQSKAKDAACMPYFGIFGRDTEMYQAVEKQNAVTQRLVNYLNKVVGGTFHGA